MRLCRRRDRSPDATDSRHFHLASHALDPYQASMPRLSFHHSRGYLAILILGAAAAACSAEDDSGDDETGGSSSTGGAPAESGGSTTTGGNQGSSGQGSVEPPPEVGDLMGWAAVPGLGMETTTGGLDGDTVTATTTEELVAYAASEEPLTILIANDLDAPRVDVLSNKTLVGAAGGITIRGGLRIRPESSGDEMVQNVIVRNIRVDGTNSRVEGNLDDVDNDDDAIMVYRAHHVWIDHCEVWDGRDGNLDIVHASDFITVSWCKFRYSDNAPYEDHRFSNLIGHSDSANAQMEDRGTLNVTYHHNWWAERVHERMPRVRFGQVHVLNNYYSSTGNNYAVRAGFEANVLIESNYFDGVDTPHEINEDDGGPAVVTARGNEYVATTGAQDATGTAFEPPYDYSPDPAADIKAEVTDGAGPE